VTVEAARAAIATVAPAFEIIERRGDFAGDLDLALADNSQQKAFVTGPAQPLRGDRALYDSAVEIVVDGVVTERAHGSPARTGDPVAAVAWLANKLADFGRRIEAGQRIMSGSFTRQYPLARGARIEARFDPYGTVAAAFR
jgi:2-keto-4-pentenoate hydratase